MTAHHLSSVIFAAVICCAASFARADVYRNGDLIVTDSLQANMQGIVLDIDPLTKAQTVIANITQPVGVCMDLSGNILVADYGGNPGIDTYGGIYRIDRATGNTSLVSSGGLLAHPTQLRIDGNGQILVAQEGTDQQHGALLKIDPTTGSQTVVGTGPNLRLRMWWLHPSQRPWGC